MPLNKTIGFIPQDDRPASLAEPVFFAQQCGCQPLLPPADLIGHRMLFGQQHPLLDWLSENISLANEWIVSLDMLAYGGLIASRELLVDYQEAAAPLIRLKELKKQYPEVKIYAFQSIRRLGSTVVNVEDIENWWVQHTSAGQTNERERNRRINFLAVQLLDEGVFERVHFLQEDARPKGPQLDDQKAIIKLITQNNLLNRALITTGTDEATIVMFARILNQEQTNLGISYSNEAGAKRVGLYEDRHVAMSVHGQLYACGLQRSATETANVMVFVWCPDRLMRDLVFELPFDYLPEETQFFIDQMKTALQEGKRVVLLDVAYANGADAAFMDLLSTSIDLTTLTGYSAWNTTANAAGSAMVQATGLTTPQFLLLRLLSDWGYQSVVRPVLNLELTSVLFDDIWNISPANLDKVQQKLQTMMQDWCRTALPSFPLPAQITYRLPWERTFELEISFGPAG